MHFSKIFVFLILLLLSSQCAPSVSELKTIPFPDAYSLADFQKIILTDDMEEISGIEWVGEDQLWAIEDESSIIYKLDTETGKILKKRKFSKNKDIEDLEVVNEVAWVLQSNGTLYEVTSPLSKNANTTEHHFPIKEKRDIEAIVASETEPFLFVFCKVCKWDIGPDQASIFRFDLMNKSYDSIPFKTLKRDQIQPLLRDKKAELLDIQPSAAAFHPIEKQFYILSSSGKWLLITDSDFIPKDVFRLDSRLFKQPEGLAFDPHGNMYISNEAQDGEANILKFVYTP
ncbi:SdiA-regulated domain-containing protein [Algoriphagus sp. D3-2-R+10]|uniref:SdiA-regulated domain-containing protein n=1 Tax=Algoriphagus aurantiacus TaxID=3103948 RepID=UPI002B36577F|nr:SdiA-regulated domain-containing protein [Algoriphagus sp. D3-2-R+10]MEB2774068.1 SdiA-regulated domain-containing protein [Algoriphagus sp. D3-2-R+10]